jgi:glutamine amidotransferase
MNVAIIDYGVGNLGSIARALEQLGAVPQLITSPSEVQASVGIILPGVGNFAECMSRLNEGGWTAAIQESAGAGMPILGICLGMQLLASVGTEGPIDQPAQTTPGLDLIKGKVTRLDTLGCPLRIPHMGWNSIKLHGAPSKLLEGIPDDTDFYFVHSYAFVTHHNEDLLATTDYGVPVTAAVFKGRVWGTQFHPEKSSRAGHRVLRNFLEIVAC